MLQPGPFAFGIAASFLWLRERRARQAAERLASATFETLLYAIDATDSDTGAHLRRVARYALILGKAADLSRRELEAVERVALFHDIGKIHEALFDIVHDVSRLTPAERRAIDTHPRRGAAVLAPLSAFYPELAHAVIAHHERWDGHGYPRRIKGSRIPIVARVVAIADTFDVVAHGRRYRPGTGAYTASAIIAEGRGTQFDPNLVDLLMLPPVLDQFAEAHRNAYQLTPGRAGTTRRRPKNLHGPAIAFRWRSTTPAPAVVSAARRSRG